MRRHCDLQAFLAFSALPRLGQSGLAKLLSLAGSLGGDLRAIWEAGPTSLPTDVVMPAGCRSAWRDQASERWDRAGMLADEVRGAGAELLLAVDPEFPTGLKTPIDVRTAWPYLFVYGDIALLHEPSVALLSSRDVPPNLVTAIAAMADALARRDVPICTSTNKAGFQVSATATKRHGAPVVLALDRGLPSAFPNGFGGEPVSASRIWDPRFEPDIQLLVSAHPWNGIWHASSGTRRDELIVNLAAATVVIHARRGGTMEALAGKAHLAGRPVFRWRPAGEPSGSEVCDLLPGLPGASADEAVETLLARLRWPRAPRMDDYSRSFRTEISRFAIRLAQALVSGVPLRTLSVQPRTGPFVDAARSFGVTSEGSGGAVSLLDCGFGTSARLDAVDSALAALPPTGLLIALVPQEWLVGEQLASRRRAWLQRAALAATVTLPSRPQAAAPPLALAAWRKSPTNTDARVFRPAQPDAVDGFRLRRYLTDVLSGLTAESDSPVSK